MSREWKPGDVAALTFFEQSAIGLRNWKNTGWKHSSDWGCGSISDGVPTLDARPLAVIDPEDEGGDLSRLWSILPNNLVSIDQLQAALREFADPTPPKPDEPTGLGAVVEDAAGSLCVRTHATGFPWHANLTPDDKNCTAVSKYEGLNVVRVLSEGVTS